MMHNSSTHDSNDDGSQLFSSQLPLGEPPPLLMLLLLSSPYYWACGASFNKDN